MNSTHTVLCKFYNSRKGCLNADCTYVHDAPLKNKMCWYTLNGNAKKCPYGYQCHFAHTPAELNLGLQLIAHKKELAKKEALLKKMSQEALQEQIEEAEEHLKMLKEIQAYGETVEDEEEEEETREVDYYEPEEEYYDEANEVSSWWMS